MKILASVEITKGFDSWITVNDKLTPLIAEHGLKFHQAVSNFEETKVFMLIENTDPEKSMAFLSRDDVLQDRLDAGVKVETQEMVSDIARIWTNTSSDETKLLAKVEIEKGFDHFLKVKQEKLVPLFNEVGIKYVQVMSNFEENKIFMIFENQHPDKMMEFLTRDDVTDCRLEAGVKIETQEMISDLKRVWMPKS
tara:strand:- start:176 stop:760 length:585 start_codon:yes stop_codon:yes gene_type:complete